VALMFRALGWLFGLVGFLLLVVYGAAYAFLDTVPTALHYVGGLGGLGVVAFLFLDWGALSEAGKDQSVARSALASFATVLALGIVVAGNVVANRYDTRWDLTKDKRYSLSEQSVDIVKGLDREVEVIAFFTTGSPEGEQFRTLMEEYARETTLLKTNFYDPFSDNVLAAQMKASEMGTVILKSGDSERRLDTDFGEEAFTNALVKVTSDKEHTVCGVYGHGEREDMDDQTPDGLGVALTRLQGQNYSWRRVNVLDEPPTPEACEVVVVAGPQGELLPGELDRLASYVAAGGSLLFMVDPMMTPGLAADLARYGVKVGDDIVLEGDPNRQLATGAPTMIVLDDTSFDIHPITAKLDKGVVLGLARSVGKGADVAGLAVQELAHTHELSWAETGYRDTSAPLAPDAADVQGKVSLAVAVEVQDPANLRLVTPVTAPAIEGADGIAAAPAEPAPAALPTKAGGKVVVIGDSDFMSNQLVLARVNQDLFLNTVAWMVGEEDQISVRTNEAGAAKLTLDVLTLFVAAVVAVVAVPGLTVAGAVYTWLVRRRR
jgi:ABC-type uncharacterized transport system involved in gliding motility auxiliary subunit